MTLAGGIVARGPVIAWAGLLALSGSAFAQGETGFLRGEGKLDVVLSYDSDSYDVFFLGSSPFAPPIEDVERQRFGIYAAYGLTSDIDLTLSGAYVNAEGGEEFEFAEESSLENGVVQLKWRAFETELGPGRLSFLLAPGIQFPLDDYPTYDDNAINGIGEHDVVLRGRVIAHYQIGPVFAAIESGYDHRNGELSDEVPLNITVGSSIGSRFFATAFYSAIYGDPRTVDSPLEPITEDYTRYGVGLFVSITEALGVSLGVRRTDEGRNVSEGFTVGAVLRF